MSSSSPSIVNSAVRLIAFGRDALAVDVPRAVRQQVFLEHDADRVEVVLGRHVQHGVVFVVEAAVRFGVVEIAAQQILVEIPVRLDVPARIHRDETGVLQEARIDACGRCRDSSAARRGSRCVSNHDSGCVVARLLTAVGHSRGSIGPPIIVSVRGVGFAGRGHQRDRGEHRHGRLAHRDHVQPSRADVAR